MLAATSLTGHWRPTQRPSSARRHHSKHQVGQCAMPGGLCQCPALPAPPQLPYDCREIMSQLAHSLATPTLLQVLQTAACAAADDGAAAAADGPQQQAALPRRSALAAALAAVAAPWLATSPALAVSALSAPVGISLVYGTLSSLWASARCMGSIKPARDVQQSHPRRWLASRHSHRDHFQPLAAWSPSLRHTLWGSRAGQRCCQGRAGQVREEEEAGAPGLVRDATVPFCVLLHRLFAAI